MGKTVIKENMFPEIVECYNREGKSAALNLLRNKYSIRNTYFVMNRIKGSGKYHYDKDTDSFSEASSNETDGIFMNLDELCGGGKPPSAAGKEVQSVFDNRTSAMEKLVHELVSDRLLALSRYIVLDTSTRTIMVDQTSLLADGYNIVTH